MPVEAAGVLYLLPVLLASSYWGLAVGVGTSVLSAARVQLLPHPADRAVHDRRGGELGRARSSSWSSPAVTSTLAGAARARADEAERRRREADLTAEMARVLLGGESIEDSLRVVGQRIAQAFELPWVEVEPGWSDSDRAPAGAADRRRRPARGDGRGPARHRARAGRGCSSAASCRASRPCSPRRASARASRPR